MGPVVFRYAVRVRKLQDTLIPLVEVLSGSIAISLLRWQSEAQLRLSNQELNAAAERARKLVIESEKANAAKGEFLARMSHEIRTPMNGILGMARLMSYQEMPEEQREQIEIILQSGEMLLHVINDVLDFSKIESGKLLLNNDGFDLAAMLESVHGLFRIRANEKGLVYHSKILTPLPGQLVGDSVRIRQLLMNLIGNAIKFTATGEVRVETTCLKATADKATIQFEVSDSGPGIPEDRLETIFEEFSQLDGSSARHFEGTGLGLAIVRRLLHLMNGDIRVTSEEGKGSVFTVTMTLDLAAEMDGPVATEREAILRDRKVLVVDDNHNNLKIMAGFLEQWQCRHTETCSPVEALNLLGQAHRAGDPFLCAIIDMMMPEWDGIQLAQRIRRQPELAETLLMVMLSSVDVRQQEAELRKAGFVAVMQKPVHATHLHQILIEALYQQGRNKPAVLLVDDDGDSLEISKRIFQKFYEIYTAGDVAAAEKILAGNHGIDLMFCDHNMPGENGLDFCKRLQASGSTVVRVLMTGHIEQNFLLDAMNSQALFRYLVKPASRDLLLKTAQEALLEGRKRSREKIKIALSDSMTVKEPGRNAERAAEPQPGEISRVLVAEDNLVNQKVAAQFLKRIGVAYEIVANGRQALDLVKDGNFQAVIMDLHMPEMDGLTATRAIRDLEQREGKARLPIIALTADAIKGDREKCREAGMDDYITKPLKLKALEDVLAKYLPGLL